MRIEWTVGALGELDHMLAFIASKSPEGASLVAERVLKAEETILLFPHAGRHDSETDTYDVFILKTRVVLTYTVRNDIIWVVTVWHTSRDPETKPKRTV